MREIDQSAIIEAAIQAASQVNGPLSRSDFERLTGISDYHIYKAFPAGGWSEVKRLAQLERHSKDNKSLSNSDLLSEYHRVASELEDIPTWVEFASKARISADVIRRRFGGLQGTLVRYREWLQSNDPNSPLLQKLDAKSKHEIAPPPVVMVDKLGIKVLRWTKGNTVEYGPPIDFRGLRHAPINEQGVVFLFGMVSYELGFIVEAIHASFPDCEAKRCVDRARNRWQRVRIEFEYESVNFRDHGHDPSQCDVVLCWQHNWPECPLEVIELRSLVGELDG